MASQGRHCPTTPLHVTVVINIYVSPHLGGGGDTGPVGGGGGGGGGEKSTCIANSDYTTIRSRMHILRM